jgi:VRR-NUC domain
MIEIRFALVRTGRVLLWRNSVGGVRGTRLRYGLGVGSADLVGLLRGGLRAGRLFAVEVKTETGRLSVEQREWLHAVNAAGGYACVARTVPEALSELGAACR